MASLKSNVWKLYLRVLTGLLLNTFNGFFEVERMETPTCISFYLY